MVHSQRRVEKGALCGTLTVVRGIVHFVVVQGIFPRPFCGCNEYPLIISNNNDNDNIPFTEEHLVGSAPSSAMLIPVSCEGAGE